MDKITIQAECMRLALGLSKDFNPKKKTITIKGVDYFEPVEGVYVWIKDALNQTKFVFEVEEDMKMDSKFFFVCSDDNDTDAEFINFEEFASLIELIVLGHLG